MGIVADKLVNLLHRQIQAHGTVVWFDPEHAYLEVAHSLIPEQLANTSVRRYDPETGFIQLRRQLEALWAESNTPPRLLLYVPLARAETHHALIEFELAGVVVGPGQQPQERKTALPAVAKQALEPVLPPAALQEIIGQAEAGQLSLAELDDLAEKGIEAHTGAVAVIFGTGNALEVAIRFLADSKLDHEIEARQALGNLGSLLHEALGVRLPDDQGPAALRASLARQVLVTELLEDLGNDVPEALRTFPLASSPTARETASELARAWRNRRDVTESYVHWAGRVQAEIGLGSLDLDLDALAHIGTFVGPEVGLQSAVEAALSQRASTSWMELVEARLSDFWATQQPEIKARWEVIGHAGRVLLKAARVERALKGKTWSASELLSHYACADEPWCDLDTAQRHLERDFHRFELDLQQHESLTQLVAKARQRYAAVSDRLAELFTRAYAADRFEVPEALLQADVYRKAVVPATESGSVAYVLVDALRLEMARELLSVLDPDWTSELVPALATPPTLTEIGMAALLPGAERGVAVVQAEGNRLATVIAGTTLTTRQERMAYLAHFLEDRVATATLDQLAPLSDMHLKQAIKSADLVVVTASEEIDGLCENNPALARRMLDDVLNQLRRGIKTLFSLGIQTVVISADHGYLFGERLTSGQAIDPPGGQTVALKRRVWVGQGGADSPGCLRVPLSAFGIGGELEMATPWSLSCFKVRGGAMEYYHGGLSLPELIIPVVTVRAPTSEPPVAHAQVRWTLTLGSQTISTRFVSITIEGQSTELLQVQPPRIRPEVRSGEQAISVPVSASYGFDETTKDVQLALGPDKPQTIAANTVTLMITETPSVDQVTVHMLDATTGVSLARLDGVPFSIAL